MNRQKIRKLTLLISLLLFPITLYYFSPYLIIQGGFAGVATGSFIVFIVLFATSLILGRSFCAWLCPAGSIQEIAAPINPKSCESRRINLIKYVIWVPWMATIVLAFGRAGGLKHVDLFYMTTGGLSATDSAGYIMYILVVSLFLLFSLFVGRRAACHTLCWMAPFMIIGSKIKNGLKYPSLHLEAKPDACVSCQLCNRKCTMGLDVNQMVLQGKMENNECILCGECVDTCAKKAIRYAFAYQRSEGESR